MGSSKRSAFVLRTRLLLTVCGALPVWAGTSHLEETYSSLSHEIFNAQARGDWRPPANSATTAEVITELHALVNATVQESLAASNPSSASIQKALDDLQGDSQLLAGRLADWERKNPFADLNDINGMPTLVTAFGIMSGGYGIPQVQGYIQFYAQIAGAWKLQQEVGSEFNDRRFSVARVPSLSPNEIWYLAWGKVIGDTGSRLRVILYGFDGSNVRTISERDNLHGGTLSIADDRVVLKYDEAVPPGDSAHGRRITETLHAGVSGLERVTIDYSPAQ